MEKLSAVEMILGGAIPTFDAKTEHEKATQGAKDKAKKLFGDAKERSDAKKKEKQKGTYPIAQMQIWKFSQKHSF